ncbi:hypothetical protein N1851_009641 [Merluccius polli]|uniref:Uncharacterized protein n=1 Tax=Merluccius polli TaxID=89951 RepID=A0AA47P3U1_MERPO|nr:hypothetical protein N1851_009641 [Merluccius polli]
MDWQMKADLGKQLRFPEHIVETTLLRPDIVLFSDSTKQVVLLDLTVPWEERMEEANERNTEVRRLSGGVPQTGVVCVCRSRWAVEASQHDLIAKHTACLASQGHARERPSKPQQRQLRRPLDGCGSRGVIRGYMLRHKSGLDQSWLGRLGKGV